MYEVFIDLLKEEELKTNSVSQFYVYDIRQTIFENSC